MNGARAERARSWLNSGLIVAVACGLAACASPAQHNASPEEIARGRALFADPKLSSSTSNPFSCETCHDLEPTEGGVLKPGAPLAGATLRPTFWDAQENDLLEAISVCTGTFMLSSKPLSASEPHGIDLYAYLESLEPGDPAPQPFTLVGTIADVPRGDATTGADVFARTCAPCHGAPHTGAGSIEAFFVPVLPEDTLRSHSTYDAQSLRLIFVEKIRHGAFLGYGGEMPPFSRETLSDSEVSDILETLGVLGQ